MYQSIPLMELLNKMSELFCVESFPPTLSICANMLFVIGGYNQYEIELDTVRCEFIYWEVNVLNYCRVSCHIWQKILHLK